MRIGLNSELMPKMRQTEITLLSLSLGLALGPTGGQMLHSQVETESE